VGNDVNRALLEQTRCEIGGLAAFLSREDNIQRQARILPQAHAAASRAISESSSALSRVTTSSRAFAELYHGMPVRLYGRYKGGGKTHVKLPGTILGKPLSTSVEFDLPREPQDTKPRD
jgi:hypothetical protein